MSEPEKKKTKRMVPIKEGMFRLPDSRDGKPVLVGSRCPKCKMYFFPKRAVCLNCYHVGLDAADLSSRGKILTFTIARQTPPGSLIEAPYVIGVVELPEVVAVETVIKDVEFDKVRVGMEVEICLVKMREDGEGNDVMSFMFKPV